LGPRESKRDATERIALGDHHYGYRRIAMQLRRDGLPINAKTGSQA
jgi:hypothetical protein